MEDSSKRNSVQIAGTDIRKIEYRGQQVVTFAMIDKVHKRPDGTAGRSFRENRERFVDGDDCIELTSDEIRRMSLEGVLPRRTARATLITKRGYLKIAKTLGDDKAWEVFDEMIERYFAVEQIVETAKVVHLDRAARETRLFMRQALQIAGLAGLAGNQRLIAANRSTRKATGFDYLDSMGIPHMEAPQNDVLLTATDIGKQLGAISAIRVNHLLSEHGFQIGGRDSKGHGFWKPTEKGIKAGGVMVDVERSNKTGQARQLRWASNIVATLRDIIGGEAA
ncbi:hypothetical protein DEM27_10320 [Metarhizobium album]|uniref:KilA-N DNA-binding domain-containing protein n=1 Tax=Metarhizobium album TaxID=2182425 RepID=A0A2U2DU54_9HYPH|nr:ORF6N domain-containing protein [Rhizobium album]PWE56749.1 hypothetical protein DEM27_10320 [Rhizobium album]